MGRNHCVIFLGCNVLRFRVLGLLAAVTALLMVSGTAVAVEPGRAIRQFGVGEVHAVAFSPDGSKALIGGHNVAIVDVNTGAMLSLCVCDEVYYGAFSPDGSQVAVASKVNGLSLFQTQSGQRSRKLLLGAPDDGCVVFHPDGQSLFVAYSTEVQRLDTFTGNLIARYQGENPTITDLAISPDGSLLLSGGTDQMARIWDVESGEILWSFTSTNNYISAVDFTSDGSKFFVAEDDGPLTIYETESRSVLGELDIYVDNAASFSPDGNSVLVGTNHNVELWSVTTGERIHQFTYRDDEVYTVAFSPDGTKCLSGDRGQSAKLWDASTGELIREWSSHDERIVATAYSSDGTRVLTGSEDHTARLWDAETGLLLQELSGHSDVVNAVDLSPDGSTLMTASSDSTVKGWDALTGTELWSWEDHTASVNSMTISSDGKFVITGSDDGTAKLWSMATGSVIRTFNGHPDGVNSVDFSPGGYYVVTGGVDGSAKLWKTATGELVHTVFGDANDVLSVDFSPNGKSYAAGYQSRSVIAKLWDVFTGEEIKTFNRHVYSPEGNYFVSFSPDGNRLLADDGAESVLYEIDTGQVIGAFWGESDSSVFSPDGKVVVAADEYNCATLWSSDYPTVQILPEGKLLRQYEGGGFSMDVSPDGRYIFTGANSASEYSARVFEITTGAVVQSFSFVSGSLTSAKYSPDGTEVLVGDYEGVVYLLSIDTGDVLRTFELPDRENSDCYISSLAFSTDGNRFLAGSSNKTATLWDKNTGELLQSFDYNFEVTAVAYSPDGSKIAIGGVDSIPTIWDVQSGELLHVLDGQFTIGPNGYQWVLALEFSPDSSIIYTGTGNRFFYYSGENSLISWSVETGEVIRKFNGHSNDIMSIDFSRDGSRFVTSSLDQTAIVWDLETGKMLSKVLSTSENNYTNWMRKAKFASDKNHIVTLDSSGMLLLWSLVPPADTTGMIIH